MKIREVLSITLSLKLRKGYCGSMSLEILWNKGIVDHDKKTFQIQIYLCDLL